jgi:hypothetical protein
MRHQFYCLLAGYRVAYCRAASTLHRLSSHSRLSRPSSTPPLCSRRLVVVSHLVAPLPPLDAPPAHVLPLATPSSYIRQLVLSRTAIFVAPSLSAAAIAGILKCTAHSPGGSIANGHCSLSYGSRPRTRPPARRLTCSLLRHLRLKSASSPYLAPPFLSPPLSAPRPLPASSNAWRTLLAAASPTATVPSRTALVLQHVRLRRCIVIFTAQPSTILGQLSSYIGGR